jgi:hypothetical protein
VVINQWVFDIHHERPNLRASSALAKGLRVLALVNVYPCCTFKATDTQLSCQRVLAHVVRAATSNAEAIREQVFPCTCGVARLKLTSDRLPALEADDFLLANHNQLVIVHQGVARIKDHWTRFQASAALA